MKLFVSETHENLCCLQSLSENFNSKCVRTLDRGFDANDYFGLPYGFSHPPEG